MEKSKLVDIRWKIIGLLKSIYTDYVPEFSEITGINLDGNPFTIFVSSESGLMVNVYAPEDEDQDCEIGGGHVDRYEEGYVPSMEEIGKQADFALEMAGMYSTTVYSDEVVKEINLRIANTESQIADFRKQWFHDTDRKISDRQKRLQLLRWILELKALKQLSE